MVPTRLLPDIVPWQLAPRSFSHFPHVAVLFNRAVHVGGVLSLIAAIEAHDCKAADDQAAGTKNDEEDDERRRNLEAHVVSLVQVHVCSGVMMIDGGVRQTVQGNERFQCLTVVSEGKGSQESPLTAQELTCV